MVEYKRNPNTKCFTCGKHIYRRPAEIESNNGRVFCSQSCYGVACRKEKPCLVCKKPILAGANKKTCSRSCANTHRPGIRYKVNSSKDKAKDQRSIKRLLLKQRGEKCERCKYNMHKILQVHHKNRDRKNNRLVNLELLCPNCHAEEHYLKRA